MFKNRIHSDILFVSTIIFGFVMELFYLRPSVVTIILGFLVMLALVLLHYDMHIHEKHSSPFESALMEYRDYNKIEKYFFTFFIGLINRFRHFYHKDNIAHHINFLVLPTFLYWSSMSLLFMFRNPWFSQGIIIFSTVSFMFIMASISMVYRKAFEISDHNLHIFGVIKVYIVFLSLMASYGYFYFGYSNNLEVLTLILATTFVLLFSYAWKTKKVFVKKYALLGIMWAGILNTTIGYFLQESLANYFFAVVSLFAGYFLSFGVLKHYLKGDLTKKIFIEYLIASVVLVMLIWINTFFDKLVM